MTRVVIYDSGVGGLSVYQDIRRVCPNYEYIFVSDNQAYPYGTKTEQALMSRVLNVGKRIIDTLTPDVLVLACNTASTVCLPNLRQQCDIPVVGVVPAIKPAAQTSVSRVIGLLATPATIERDYTNALINDFANDCEVIKLGSTRLVNLAEQKLQGQTVSLDVLSDILQPFITKSRLDSVVLACTHFPLLKSEITSVFEAANRSVDLIDSGAAIADRVRSLMAGQRHIGEPINRALFTAEHGSVDFTRTLNRLGFEIIQRLNIT